MRSSAHLEADAPSRDVSEAVSFPLVSFLSPLLLAREGSIYNIQIAAIAWL